MSDHEFIGVDPGEPDSSTHTTVLVIAPPALDPVSIPIDRVDIHGPNECMTASNSTDIALPDDDTGDPGNSLQHIGERAYSPGSSLVSLLVSKGSHAVTPVLPSGVQWVQAGRRYAAYRENVHLGGIDPVTTGDPASPLWVAYAKGNRNEITHSSLVEAMQWVMYNSAEPGRLITDILQEQVGPINLRLDRDGYRLALRLKGTDNQLCIYMFDNRNATSQELRINVGLIPVEPVNAIAWLDTMVKGLKAGLQLYRDWANMPGIEMKEEEPKTRGTLGVILAESCKVLNHDDLRNSAGLPRLAYTPPQPEQVVEIDPVTLQAMPAMADLDEDAEADQESIEKPWTTDRKYMDGITFVPGEGGEWAEADEERSGDSAT